MTSKQFEMDDSLEERAEFLEKTQAPLLDLQRQIHKISPHERRKHQLGEWAKPLLEKRLHELQVLHDRLINIRSRMDGNVIKWKMEEIQSETVHQVLERFESEDCDLDEPECYRKLRRNFVQAVRRKHNIGECSDDAKRLYTDLLEGYNQFARPVKNASCAVKILFRMKLTQIADVEWHDYRLMWNPDDYGGQTLMHVPTNMIWLPDIILYNNAHGSPQVTTLTKAHVYNSGRVAWEPPVVYNFYCAINIEWFPYDEQFCELKFGSWTYYGSQLDMIQPITDLVELKIDVDPLTNETFKSWVVQQGADISEYQDSVEWDLMFISSHRHVQWYPCCDYPYIDITYKMNIRRKTLFYTINLVTPCVGITFLSCLVFYLPSDSNNKVTLCVSILVTLTVFFLLLVEIIPPTSITIPMIARYLTFTMIMILNVHYHPVSVTPVPVWIRRYILTWLPKVLLIETPRNIQKRMQGSLKSDYVYSSNTVRMAAGSRHMTYRSLYLPQPLRAACVNIAYIASNLTQQQIETDLRDDWKFVAIVIDRLFLIVFSSVIMTGTISIVLTAPTLRDRRLPATDNTSVQLPTDFKHINQTINFHDPCNWDLLMTLMKPTF